ncbi:uncharacterized protein METZ01_LOCUS405248, partial [marine metagenome]
LPNIPKYGLFLQANGTKLAQKFSLVRACSDFICSMSDCEELVGVTHRKLVVC